MPFINTIGECLGVWLRLEEDFPCAVCRSCTTKLERIIEFREGCRLCDAALKQKKQEDPSALVLFYDYPEDRVFVNGSAKPGFFQDDSDFENEPILPEVLLDVEHKDYALNMMCDVQWTQSAKELALKSYFDTYATWTADMAASKDDDEMTVVAPEALDQENIPELDILREEEEEHIGKLPAAKKSSKLAINTMNPASHGWCCLCKNDFRTPARLKNHTDHRHQPGADGYDCPECGKKFVAYSLLKQHVMRHTSSMLISCDKCGIQFMTSPELEAHRKTDGCRDVASMYGKCKYCDRMFSRRGRYIFHLKRLHPGKPLPRQTDVGLKKRIQKFKSSKVTTYNDKRRLPSDGTTPRIEENGRFVVMLKPLSQDMLRNVSNASKQLDRPLPTTNRETVVCTLCFEQFQDQQRFHAHLEQCYGTGDESSPAPPPYLLCRCRICTDVFNGIEQFLEHLRRHERPYDVKPHDCARCRKSKPKAAQTLRSPQSILGE